MVKNPPGQRRTRKRLRFDAWVGKIPWRRKWQPTPVSLPGESHGQRSLGGYTPWGRRVDMTERLSTEVAQYEHMEGYAETPEGLLPGGELYVV